MEYRIENLEQLHSFARIFLNTLSGFKNHATIITIGGDLGAGKTALVKVCARALGIKEDITSPTFVIQKEYSVENHSLFTKMIHIDAYRLEGREQLEYLGWNDLMADPQSIIFIEWPSMVEGIEMPKSTSVSIAINQDQTRAILVK